VDDLGTFWTAVGAVKTALGVSPDVRLVFKEYPEKEGFLEALMDLLSGSAAGVRAAEGLSALMRSPAVSAVVDAMDAAPRGQVELRATNLPGK
jgi:hypothetical protein